MNCQAPHMDDCSFSTITCKRDLECFIKRAQSSSYLALDTEFLREKTYYPKLCLIQIASEEEIVLIDPLAIDDLSILASLLENRQITKIFHAGNQDIEILLRHTGVSPWPLFDTQIAASLLGFSRYASYASLVAAFCDEHLAKADSFTLWQKRPLTSSQLNYAALDVFYLPYIYHCMKENLERLGRLSWLDDDFSALANPDSYHHKVEERYRTLKKIHQLSGASLAAARELASWRELRAQKRNIPRRSVLSDEQIIEICKRHTHTLDDLFLIRGVREALSLKEAREVLAALNKGYNCDPELYPIIEHEHIKIEANVDSQIDYLSAYLKMRAKEESIAFQTLCSKEDLTYLARGYFDSCSLLSGWRRKLVGNELLELIQGKRIVYLDRGELHSKLISYKGTSVMPVP